MSPDLPIITNIQRFCVHDGPGIRTTVFLKGCSLRCPWCANPESVRFGTEDGFGDEMPCEDLAAICLKDKPFYVNGGGVTFSGGEPLMQLERCLPALDTLKAEEISLAVETSLYCPRLAVEKALEYMNLFIIDIKILTTPECKRALGQQPEVFFENLHMVMNSACNVVWRFPIAKSYTDTDENIAQIMLLAEKYRARGHHAELFAVHNLAESKYKKAGLPFQRFEPPASNAFTDIQRAMEANGIPCIRLSI